MTKLEAIKYGVQRYNERRAGENVPAVLMVKNGDFLAATWSEYDHAEANGWNYAGSIADEAKALGLI